MAHILPKSGLDKILLCSSCSDRLISPTTICENGHCFCHECNPPSCPCCSKKVHANPLLDQIISICEVPCTNQEIGCPKIIRYDNLPSHTTKECDFRNVRCVLGESGKSCNELIFRENYNEHIKNCRFKNYIKDFKLNTEIQKEINISIYTGKPMFVQTVLRCEDFHFIESVYHDKATKEFFVCYHFVGKNSHSKRYKYTIKLYQDSIKALTLNCPCLPVTNNARDIKNDIRCVNVDPAKFTTSAQETTNIDNNSSNNKTTTMTTTTTTAASAATRYPNLHIRPTPSRERNPETFQETLKMNDDQNGTLGLPLLIVNGKFKNISKMSVKDLETFIPFLTKCSIYRSGALVINGVPEWWISTIQYKFPLKKPNGLSQTGYRNHLLAIVCRCYWYHDAEFLMNFCAEIADRPEIVFFKNNGDNSTSIFYVKNNIHIMTFNNENKEYDMKKPEKIEKSVKRSLLPSVLSKPAPRVITDVYLCENCDAEFSSHSDMQKHEKECYGTTVDEDDDSEGEIEILDITADSSSEDQTGFLKYFALGPKKEKENTSTSWKSKLRRGFESPSKRWVSVDMCLHKNRTVEFSSYSGKKMLEHRARRDLNMKVERSIAANEQYCYTSNRNPRELKETYADVKVTYRRDKKKFSSHQYCFNKKQRRERHKTLITGLDARSRKLLKLCKTNSVALTRLKVAPAESYRISITADSEKFIILPDGKPENQTIFFDKALASSLKDKDLVRKI